MAVDAGKAPREGTPDGGERLWSVERKVTVQVLAETEGQAVYLSSLSTKEWRDWDWTDEEYVVVPA